MAYFVVAYIVMAYNYTGVWPQTLGHTYTCHNYIGVWPQAQGNTLIGVWP